jgi:hypothetical protein
MATTPVDDSVSVPVTSSGQCLDITLSLNSRAATEESWIEEVGSYGSCGYDRNSITAAIIHTKPCCNLQKPMSALSALPLQISPSLCYSINSDEFLDACDGLQQRGVGSVQCGPANELISVAAASCAILPFQIMGAATEEAARKALCSELSRRILIEKGTLPAPKKRGFGAEVLAHVQSLIDAPGGFNLSTTAISTARVLGDVANTSQIGHISSADISVESRLLSLVEKRRSKTLGYSVGTCMRSG